jgi:hypothetical protein
MTYVPSSWYSGKKVLPRGGGSVARASARSPAPAAGGAAPHRPAPPRGKDRRSSKPGPRAPRSSGRPRAWSGWALDRPSVRISSSESSMRDRKRRSSNVGLQLGEQEVGADGSRIESRSRAWIAASQSSSTTWSRCPSCSSALIGCINDTQPKPRVGHRPAAGAGGERRLPECREDGQDRLRHDCPGSSPNKLTAATYASPFSRMTRVASPSPSSSACFNQSRASLPSPICRTRRRAGRPPLVPLARLRASAAESPAGG